MAWVRTDISPIRRGSTPTGYAPSDLQAAYNLTPYSSANGAGETVAVVDAFHDPNAASDLATYRSEYGLSACTVSSGCFTQHSFATKTNKGWALEEALDIEMVSAICPNCNILAVEAKSPSVSAMSEAERYATAGADYVSDSWGGKEGDKKFDAYYDVSGVAITAATGDDGYNPRAQWPAILPSVIGVGGTSLTSINPRTETAWAGSGSGCSKIYKKPRFQRGISTGCSKRAEADVSADANPSTGVAVYDTLGHRRNGWTVVGGTSVSSPIVAAVFALAGNSSTNDPANLYLNALDLNDITSGSNGRCGAPLCVAGPGWDGPTGLGSPNGIAAF